MKLFGARVLNPDGRPVNSLTNNTDNATSSYKFKGKSDPYLKEKAFEN